MIDENLEIGTVDSGRVTGRIVSSLRNIFIPTPSCHEPFAFPPTFPLNFPFQSLLITAFDERTKQTKIQTQVFQPIFINFCGLEKEDITSRCVQRSNIFARY